MNINDTKKYIQDDQLEMFVLYTTDSDPIILEGKVDFMTLGTVRMNDIPLVNQRMSVSLAKPTQFEIAEDSALLFMSMPKLARHPENVPAEPVPEYMDEMTSQMHMMFNQWAKSMGMQTPQEPDEELEAETIPEAVETDAEWEFDIPLDDEEPTNIIPLSTTAETMVTPEQDAGETEPDGEEVEAEPDLEHEAR